MAEKSGNIKIKRDLTHVVMWLEVDDDPTIVLKETSIIQQYIQDCARYGWPVWLVGDVAYVFAAGEWE